MLSGLIPPPFFFLSLAIKEVELQEDISHLSETCVIPLNKKEYVRGRPGAILVKEIAVRLSPNGEKSQSIA